LIFAKFRVDLINIYKVASCKTKWPSFFYLYNRYKNVYSQHMQRIYRLKKKSYKASQLYEPKQCAVKQQVHSQTE